MKKTAFIIGMMVLALGLASCGPKNDENQTTYKSFIGTWGIEKLEYWLYNIDYAGQPIAASYILDTAYDFDVNDPNYGIQLVFNKDKTGEYRDFAIDSIWFKWNENKQKYDVYLAPPVTGYDSVIYCPDTTLVYQFSYLYDNEEDALYMNMDYLSTLRMKIVEITESAFVSENRYDVDPDTHTEKMEKFYMKRVSKASQSSAKSAQGCPQRVSRLTQELFNQEH